MSLKLLNSSFITLVLWMTIIGQNAVLSAVDVQPFKDSFYVLQSHEMSHTSILQTIYDAEQARLLYGDNLTEIGLHMNTEFRIRYGYDSNCFVQIDQIRGTFWAKPYFIYLKSDSSDNMHIICYKTCSCSVPPIKISL